MNISMKDLWKVWQNTGRPMPKHQQGTWQVHADLNANARKAWLPWYDKCKNKYVHQNEIGYEYQYMAYI